jgi:hypothetical protein
MTVAESLLVPADGEMTRGGSMSGVVIAARLTSYFPTALYYLSAAVIVLGVWLSYRYWRALHEVDEPIRNEDLLAELERGGAASKMTEAELRRVRELLLGAETGREPTAKTIRSRHSEAEAEAGDKEPENPTGTSGE